MDSELLKTVGSVAGLAGLAVGLIVILFREIIRKEIFPKLPRRESYRLLQTILFLSWSIAVLGIGAWVYVSRTTSPAVASAPEAQASRNASVVAGIIVDQQTNQGIADAQISVNGTAMYQSEDTGNFRFQLPASVKSGSRVRLTVSKPGYVTLDRSVQPPVDNVTLPLSKAP